MIGIHTKAIGYLLEILNISATMLGKAIHIDRTNVSKWISGARPFHANSPHYDAVVEYIMQYNQEQGQCTLEKFLQHIYVTETITSENLRQYMDKFLLLTDIPQTAINLIVEAQGCVYYTQNPVYKGSHGRFLALMELVGVMEQADEPQELFLFDNEQFDWMTYHKEYLQMFSERVIKLLKGGHRVSIISNSSCNKAFERFLSSIYEMCTFSNFREYYLKEHNDAQAVMSYYILKNQIVVWGNKLSDNWDDLYTTIAKDPLTVSSCEILLQSLLNLCCLAIVADSNESRLQIFENIIQYKLMDDLSYLYVSGLSFTTMSRELLFEVLQQNKVHGVLETEILRLYDEHIKAYHKNTTIPLIRQISYYQNIIELSEKEEGFLAELSVLTGKEIYLNKEQIARHLKDTADLLRSAPNFNIGFLTDSNHELFRNFSCKVKRNFYYVYSNKVLKYLDEPKVVNTVINILDDVWHNEISNVFKDREGVAARLLMLSKKSNQNLGQ